MKFNVGDRVRCIGPDYPSCGLYVGKVYVVIGTTHYRLFSDKTVGVYLEGITCGFLNSRFELVTELAFTLLIDA